MTTQITDRRASRRGLLAVGLVCAFGILSAKAADEAAVVLPESPGVVESAAVSEAEEAVRKAKFQDQDERIARARNMEFYQMVAEFRKVISELADPNFNYGTEGKMRLKFFRDELEQRKLAYGSDLLLRARTMASQRNYLDALPLISEAHAATIPEGMNSTADSPLNNEAGMLIEFCNRGIAGEQFKGDVAPENVVPQMHQKLVDIDKLLNEARTYYAAKRYEEAAGRLEQVYIIDPFQPEAIQMMNDVYKQLYTYGMNRHEADIEGVFASSFWQWVEPVFPRGVVVRPASAEQKISGNFEADERLRQIIFPRIEFEDMPLLEAVRWLERQSRIYDPEKVGVRFLVTLPADLTQQYQIKQMKLTQIPLSEILRYLSEDMDVDCTAVDSSTIDISPRRGPIETLEMTLRADILEGIIGQAADLSTIDQGRENMGYDERDDTDPLDNPDGISRRSVNDSNARLLEYFKRLVDFPEGSSVSYNPRKGTLTIKNRPANLVLLRELLGYVQAVDRPMVMIEVKALEIGEDDMQELGFDWGLGVNNVIAEHTGKDSSWVFGQGSNRIANLTSGISEGINSTVLNNFNFSQAIFGDQNIFGSDNPLDISLSINALNRSERTEMMSAPKVLTSNGHRAAVRLVESYYFPDDWDMYELEVIEGGYTLTLPLATFNESSDIGIIFDVTPQVDPDNYTISLDLNPTITSFVGRDTYEMVLTGRLIVGDKETDTSSHFSVWMPIITRRNLNLTVDTYDGETVVLGGMIDSNVSAVNDKWPIFGYLPFIGRLFTSRSEVTERTNLLFFVTARLVNADGIPIRRLPNRGAPDFSR